jgi:CheY-specific phosphatase CheX
MDPKIAISDALLAAGKGQFASLTELSPCQGEPVPRDLCIVAVIGFSGDMSGALGVAADSSAARAIVHAMVPGSDAPPHDALGEVANQLLGRVKLALLRLGVVIDMATPMVIQGLRIPVLPAEWSLSHRFRSKDGAICVWLETEIDESLVLEPSAESHTSVGEMMFFS